MSSSTAVESSCTICGVTRGLDRHHVVHRQMGGSKDPAVHDATNIVTLCRRCHTNLHEGSWQLAGLPNGFRVVDRHTGEQVMRRLWNPSVDVPAVFHGVTLAEGALAGLIEAVPFLSDEQLVEAFVSAATIGKRAWLVQAAILYEAQQRSIYGARSLEAIARRFEISLRQAEKYALVWKVFFARRQGAGDDVGGAAEATGEVKYVNVDEIVLDEPSWYVVAASESPNPEDWLAYAQDRKLEDPRYSIAGFRQDIREARLLADGERVISGTASSIDSTGARWRCPWVRPYCTKSGLPVPVAQCTACGVGCATGSDEAGPKGDE